MRLRKICLQASLKNLSASITIIQGNTSELLNIQYIKISQAQCPPAN